MQALRTAYDNISLDPGSDGLRVGSAKVDYVSHEFLSIALAGQMPDRRLAAAA
jgi:hypothetical protein